MSTQQFLAGELKLDQPANLNDGLVMADGVYPIANGYAPVASFAAFQNGLLADRCIGAAGYRYTNNVYLFAATTTDIYTYTSSGYTSVASGLASTQENGVRFCNFAAYMLATNGVDAIKRFDPASPSAMTNLGGSPPTARYLAVVRGFVMAGYAGGSSTRVAWSDTGDSAIWTAGGASQAGQFDMATGGDITGYVGGEYGLCFQEQRITRWTYTADSTIWQVDEIATDCGCVAPKSLATFGKITFFWSNKGFMACDGATIQAIGDEKVDRAFQAKLDRTYADCMSAVVDPRRSLYIVAVPSSNPTTSVFIYNYAQQKWTTATVTSELLFSALSLSTSLEDLDALYGNLDAIPFSLDSGALRGGYPILMMFDGTHTLGALSGPALEAAITDGQRELVQGQRARIRGITPITDAPALTVAISGTNGWSTPPVTTEYTIRTPEGRYNTREAWNLTQVRNTIPAATAWTFYQGYEIDIEPGARK